MKVSELIEQLSHYNKDEEIVADIWTSDDIRSCAEHLENLTDEQCKVIIDYLYKNSDSEQGINNERIIIIVDSLIDSGELNYNYSY